MYQSLYNLISTYIFEGAVELGSHADLVCTLVATFGNIALIALPFVIVYKIITSVIR